MFVLVFALVFVWYGIKFVQFGWNQNSELAELPMAFIFVAWPLAGLTWVLFLERPAVLRIASTACASIARIGVSRLRGRHRGSARL